MMKKLAALLLAGIMCAGIFSGCGQKEETAGSDASSAVEMKEGQSVQTVVDQISDEIGIQMPADLDDTILKDMFYIDAANDVEAYAGKMSMTMTSADNLVAVKAKEGKKDTVVEALNKRLEDVRNTFEQYLPDQKEKAAKGQVIEKGDYVFLVIIGQDTETFDDDMTRAQEIINAAF